MKIKDKPLFRWRVTTKCDDCPFKARGAGLTLRRSLGTTRWEHILKSLLAGKTFECHKTTRATGNGTNLYCAGALEFQKAKGIETAFMQLCQMLEGVREHKQEIFKRLRRLR